MSALAPQRRVGHGIMFHHFHGLGHPVGQGSLSAETFARMLDFVGRERILSPADWMDRALRGRLGERDLCLTFDDNLLCQYEVAYPVMKALGLTGFFFTYTSVFEGRRERLEIYRYFRSTTFEDFPHFYRAFLLAVGRSPFASAVETALRDFVPARYLEGFPFYTDQDRTFRYVRDRVLGVAHYQAVMEQMLAEAHFDEEAVAQRLWMTPAQLQSLQRDGNLVGLHSHSHPTALASLSAEAQAAEYRANSQALERVLGAVPRVMSHPCNSYNDATLEVLQAMGIQLGFRANLEPHSNRCNLEFPREDHANLLKRMEAQ